MQKGYAAAKKGWALDKQSAHACLMMAIYTRNQQQQADSEQLGEQVLRLNPNYAYFAHSNGLF